MIEYKIKVDNEKVLDEYHDREVTLQEVSLMIYRLEELKINLLAKDFKSEFEAIEEDQGEEQDDNEGDEDI